LSGQSEKLNNNTAGKGAKAPENTASAEPNFSAKNESVEQEAPQTAASAVATATAPPAKDSDSSLGRILAMNIPVIVKITEKRMTVGSILKFKIGNMISFDKDAYQHVDLMVNNCTIGLGQTVKIGEKFGLKITQIGDITHTIKSLGGQHTNHK